MNKKLMIPVLMAALAGGTFFAADSFAGPHHGGPRHGDGYGYGPGYGGRGPGNGPCYGGPGYGGPGYGPGCDGPAFRGGCPGMGWGHRGHHGYGFGYRAMSPEQRAAFDKIIDEYTPRMEPLRDQIFVKRQELRALRNASNPDVQQVRQTAEELVKLHNQMADLHDEMMDKISKEVGAPDGYADRPAKDVKKDKKEKKDKKDKDD